MSLPVGTSAAPTFGLDLSLLLAPMVGGSELAFRLLCRAHGVTLTVAPMWHADDVLSSSPSHEMWHACPARDSPCFFQLAGRDPAALSAAAARVTSSGRFHGIDLNLGCPQEDAAVRGYGAYMCARPSDPATAVAAVAALLAGTHLPVSAKVRLWEDAATSAAYAARLRDAGCAFLCVHGRTRGTPTSRTARRRGPADWAGIAAVVAGVAPLPVVMNGMVQKRTTRASLSAGLAATGAAGVACGEGLLGNPALGDARVGDGWEPGVVAHRAGALIAEYLCLCGEHPPPTMLCVAQHVGYMLGKAGRGRGTTYIVRGRRPHAEVHAHLVAEGVGGVSLAALEALGAWVKDLVAEQEAADASPAALGGRGGGAAHG